MTRLVILIQTYFFLGYDVQEFIIKVTLKSYENRQILKEFIGDRVCNNVYHTDGKFAGCPLKNNTKYVYRSRQFEVYELFPVRSLLYGVLNNTDV